MEDATTMPAAIVMDPLDEDVEREEMSAHSHSRSRSEAEGYDALPNPANNVPLLENNAATDTADVSNDQSLGPPQRDVSRASMDSTSQESSSLMRVNSNNAHLEDSPSVPLGPTPAYFEVVEEDAVRQPLAENVSPPSSPEAPARNNRQSGFRTFLNRMSIHGATTTGHQRVTSGGSALTTSTSHPGHRPSPSQNSSFFRTLTRQSQRSTHTHSNSQHLTSPSLISLQSISSPLTHTAVRTEFTYPKTGPTPEQLMIIASRESIGRFGVPYGPDAVQFAASASMHELLPPPPEFDTVGPSGRRSTSRLRTETSGTSAGAGTGDGHARNDSNESNGSSLPEVVDSPTEQRGTLPTASATQSSRLTARPSSPQSQSPINLTGSSSASRGGSTTEFGLKVHSPNGMPPTSFHDPRANTMRSESVASMYSARTYATAAESLDTGTAKTFAERYGQVGTDNEDNAGAEAEDEEGPQTATAAPPPPPEMPMDNDDKFQEIKHEQEPTDVTIKPSIPVVSEPTTPTNLS